MENLFLNSNNIYREKYYRKFPETAAENYYYHQLVFFKLRNSHKNVPASEVIFPTRNAIYVTHLRWSFLADQDGRYLFAPSSFLKSMTIKKIWLEKLHFQYWFKPNNFRMELGMIRQWNLPKNMSHRLISKVIKVRHHLSTKPISWRRRVEGVRGCFVNEIGFRKWILCKHFRKATFSEILDIGSYKRNSKWLMYGFFYYSWLFSYAGKFWTKARKMLFASSLKL